MSLRYIYVGSYHLTEFEENLVGADHIEEFDEHYLSAEGWFITRVGLNWLRSGRFSTDKWQSMRATRSYTQQLQYRVFCPSYCLVHFFTSIC